MGSLAGHNLDVTVGWVGLVSSVEGYSLGFLVEVPCNLNGAKTVGSSSAG